MNLGFSLQSQMFNVQVIFSFLVCQAASFRSVFSLSLFGVLVFGGNIKVSFQLLLVFCKQDYGMCTA